MWAAEKERPLAGVGLFPNAAGMCGTFEGARPVMLGGALGPACPRGPRMLPLAGR